MTASGPSWRVLLGGGAAFAVAAMTSRGLGRELDRRLYRGINMDRGLGADAFFRGITELGSLWASVGGAAALAGKGRRREGLDALGAAGAMWLAGQGLKRLVRRPRPYRALEDPRLLIAEPQGTSWPSSHPAVLLAFLTVATRNLQASPSVRGALTGLAGTVGLSRIHLGVHYPADVVGGLLLGRAVADLWSSFVSQRLVGGALPVGSRRLQ